MFLLAAACGDSVTAPAGGGEGGSAPGETLDAETFYLERVHPELAQSCGVCHQTEADCTPRFMASTAPGSYEALGAYPGLVTHADSSDLVHHGAHTGPALTLTQEALVRAWLALEVPGEPEGKTQLQALDDLGACMRMADFEATGMHDFAYQQTKYGPCGSCHKTGEAGTWIGYNAEEMFAKNTQQPWIKRLVEPVFDDGGTFVGLKASARWVDKVELANQCGSSHPAALVPAKLEQALVDYFELSNTRMLAGTCDALVDDEDEEEDPDDDPEQTP